MIDAILSALDNPQQSTLRQITVIEENGEEKSISYAALAQQALAVSSALTELGLFVMTWLFLPCRHPSIICCY
jgi:hypothetical protein